MSTKYKKWGDVPPAVLAERMRELADAIMEGPDVRDREFTRRVPAELDRDADLVLEQSAEAMDHMAYQVAQLREALDDLIGASEEIGGEHVEGWLRLDMAADKARAALKATEEG